MTNLEALRALVARTKVHEHSSSTHVERRLAWVVDVLVEALEKQQDFGGCNCDHDDEHCCAKMGEWCSKCDAAAAIARAAKVARPCATCGGSGVLQEVDLDGRPTHTGPCRACQGKEAE